jgi:hypothetical protein
MDALNRRPNPKNDYPAVFGVDFARTGGDATCVCIRKGYDVMDFKYLHGLDVFDVAKEIFDLAQIWKPESIVCDSTGLGSGYYDALRKLFPNQVMGVGFGDGAKNSVKFRYMRDEMWYSLRTIFMNEQITIPENENLRLALSTTQFKEMGTKIKIEPKDVIRKRLGKSPDEGDALALSFCANDIRKHNSYTEDSFKDPYDLLFEKAQEKLNSWMSV